MDTPILAKIVEDVLRREGGSAVTNDPADAGGLTQYGLTKRDHPAVWADGQVTADEARQTYLQKYIVGPGFDRLPATHRVLLEQLVDFGVNSGPAVAVQKLQQALKMPVDGVFGPQTLAATVAADPQVLARQLVKARVEMLCRIVQKNPSQVRFLVGWVTRALEFLS
jgi:lysozyme family protein